MCLVGMLAGFTGCASSGNSSSAASSSGSAISSSSGSIDGALKGVTLKIGTDTSFVPFVYPDSNNNYIGFDIDMVKALSDKLGFKYELSPMDFTALLTSVQTKKLDMGASGITITDARKKVMDISEPYYDAGLLIMVNKKNTDIKSIKDLSGKKLAIKEGTASLDYVNKNVPDAKVTTFPNIENAYMEVERGAADAVVYDTPNILSYLKQNPNSNCKTVGENFEACQYGYVFQKGSKYTAYINKALDEFKSDGTYDKIYTKWFGAKK